MVLSAMVLSTMVLENRPLHSVVVAHIDGGDLRPADASGAIRIDDDARWGSAFVACANVYVNLFEKPLAQADVKMVRTFVESRP